MVIIDQAVLNPTEYTYEDNWIDERSGSSFLGMNMHHLFQYKLYCRWF